MDRDIRVRAGAHRTLPNWGNQVVPICFSTLNHHGKEDKVARGCTPLYHRKTTPGLENQRKNGPKPRAIHTLDT